jgi:hypothetical protein
MLLKFQFLKIFFLSLHKYFTIEFMIHFLLKMGELINFLSLLEISIENFLRIYAQHIGNIINKDHFLF